MIAADDIEDALDGQLTDILRKYVEAAERAQAPDWREIVSSNPEYTADLVKFFTCRDLLDNATAPLRALFQESRWNAEVRMFRAHFGDIANFPSEPGQADLLGPGNSVLAKEACRLGDFRIVREIGRGGMGVVYEAEQLSLGRRVALKILQPAISLAPGQLQRFHNEARTAALLRHPHIVPVYTAGCERGLHYYAMQLVEGQGVSAFIDGIREKAEKDAFASTQLMENNVSPQRIANASWSRASELIMQAAEGLHHAHQHGVVHRDIKPANLLADVNGNVWILDFGLASVQGAESLAFTGEIAGTLRYMSPEQAQGKPGPVDHRTDIYSLGVTFYELLTRTHMIEGHDRDDLLQKIARQEPKRPRLLDQSIPVGLEAIVFRAVAKSASDRYATAQELATDIRRLLESMS